ncbi:SHOCT domain-containing protein [Streptomyces sp. NPDC047971]|uniref:SHOCT domain-containing protein n=1 Tax=Streptomyces sp. NPDC047971 TaxID=3154499 RepID=UPI0033E95EC1
MTQRIVEKRSANHTLHIVLTVCTCGIWAITGWPIAAMMGRKTVTRIPTYPQQYPQQQYAPPQQAAPVPPQQPQPAAPSWAKQTQPHGQQPSPDGQHLIAGELARLAQLRDQGVLTEAEFETQKARLLGP